MTAIPVSHVTEQPGDIQFPWIVRCQRCGAEVARLDQAELTAMVMDEETEPVICFSCETQLSAYKRQDWPELPMNQTAPWPTISVPRSIVMGLSNAS